MTLSCVLTCSQHSDQTKRNVALPLRQSAWENEQLYSEATRLDERGIVLLHGNSFQRNLWSETRFGLHITAMTEKWADCRNTNGLMNHLTWQRLSCFYSISLSAVVEFCVLKN